MDGAVYNLISDRELQVNARFVFLTAGTCPIVDGMQDRDCWTHSGSYMGEVSFQHLVDGTVRAAQVTSGSASKGFASVQVNGEVLHAGENATFGPFSVHIISRHRVLVHTAQFDFELRNSDQFVNQAVSAIVPLSSLRSHGLLGRAVERPRSSVFL